MAESIDRRSGFFGNVDVSSFTLKVVAIVAMTMNHAANIFFYHLPFVAQCILYGAGGLTFPIMAFLLVEGYRKTSNLKKYAFRLGVFALISQIPYSLFLAPMGNVLFTLLLGLAVLYLNDHLENRGAFWLSFAGIALIGLFLDWGFIGVIMIYLFHVLENQKERIAWPVSLAIISLGLPRLSDFTGALMNAGDWSYLPMLLYPLVGCTLTIPLLSAYRGRRGQSMKWFFYAYYPTHIAVLGLLNLMMFGGSLM